MGLRWGKLLLEFWFDWWCYFLLCGKVCDRILSSIDGSFLHCCTHARRLNDRFSAHYSLHVLKLLLLQRVCDTETHKFVAIAVKSLDANLSKNLKCSVFHLPKLKVTATFNIMTIDSFLTCLTPHNTEIDQRSGADEVAVERESWMLKLKPWHIVRTVHERTNGSLHRFIIEPCKDSSREIHSSDAESYSSWSRKETLNSPYVWCWMSLKLGLRENWKQQWGLVTPTVLEW